MGTVLVNYSGKTRKATINGREYIVARATLIVPGVLNGSKGALYYPPDEVAKNHDAWNGIPLTNGHPAINGANVSARSPSIIQSHGLGHVYNVNVTKNGRLRGEAWFDVKSCERVRPEILNRLKSGEPIELSTGLFTRDQLAENGAHHNGRKYTHVARDYRPDHLAILLDVQGACSLRDGCGVLVDNAACILNESNVCLNCGGKGGKPGPCPSGIAKRDTNLDTPIGADLEQASRAHKLGTDATNSTFQLLNSGTMGQKPNAASRNTITGIVDLTRRVNKRAILGSANNVGQTAKAVVQAQKAHEKATRTLLDVAQSDAGAAYELRKAAAKHDLAAKSFGEMAARMKPTGNESNEPINSHSGDDMATKKEKMVAFLTANCDCWKGEKDAEILSNFDEPKLKTLIDATKAAKANDAALNEIRADFGDEAEGLTANAMPAFVKAKAAPAVPTEDGEMEEEAEAVPPPPMKKGKKKVPAMNQETETPAKPPTLNEWLASAPVEVQEIVTNARAVEKGAKEAIVKKLVGNSSAKTKTDRESLAAFLMAKGLPELNQLSKLSVNRAAPTERDPMDFLTSPARKPAPAVNYGGMGEDFDDDEPTGNAEDTWLDAPLTVPTVNWAEEAKLIPTGGRRNK